MKYLIKVYLNNTGINSLSALTGLGSLETVYAAGNAITSLSGFNQLGALRKLVVSNNRITDLAPLENGDCTKRSEERAETGLSPVSRRERRYGGRDGQPAGSGRVVHADTAVAGARRECAVRRRVQRVHGLRARKLGTVPSASLRVRSGLSPISVAAAVCNYNQSGQYVNTTLTATADAGWRFAWWQGMSAPWNGSVVTYTANTSVTFTGEPRGRTLRAVFSLLWPVSRPSHRVRPVRVSKGTKNWRPSVAKSGAVGRPATTKAMRADLDALLRKAFPANPPSWDYGVVNAPRWYTWDGNGGATYLPNGILDGHEFYLLERVLKEGASLVTEQQATEAVVAFYRNQVTLRNKLGTRVTAQEANALAAYATLGDSGSIAALSTFIQTTFNFTPAPSAES